LPNWSRKLGARRRGRANPRRSRCIWWPVGRDATATALDEGLDPTRTLAVDCLFPTDKRRTLMTTPVTAPAIRTAAHGLLASDGVPVFGDPRFAWLRRAARQSRRSSTLPATSRNSASLRRDIDAAVTLGLGYPRGPLAWVTRSARRGSSASSKPAPFLPGILAIAPVPAQATRPAGRIIAHRES